MGPEILGALDGFQGIWHGTGGDAIPGVNIVTISNICVHSTDVVVNFSGRGI